MSQKNETPALIGALLVTLGLLGGGAWWLTQKSGFNLGNLFRPGQSTPAANQSPANPSTNQSSPASSTTANSFTDVQNVPSGLFSYGGSTSWAPLRSSVDTAMQSARPEFKLRYVNPVGSPPGSGTGIKMLINDELDFSQSSRPISDKVRHNC